MPAAVSEPAARGLARLSAPARELGRRLADGQGVVWRGAGRVGPLCIGIAIGWRPALEREEHERHG